MSVFESHCVFKATTRPATEHYESATTSFSTKTGGHAAPKQNNPNTLTVTEKGFVMLLKDMSELMEEGDGCWVFQFQLVVDYVQSILDKDRPDTPKEEKYFHEIREYFAGDMLGVENEDANSSGNGREMLTVQHVVTKLNKLMEKGKIIYKLEHPCFHVRVKNGISDDGATADGDDLCAVDQELFESIFDRLQNHENTAVQKLRCAYGSFANAVRKTGNKATAEAVDTSTELLQNDITTYFEDSQKFFEAVNADGHVANVPEMGQPNRSPHQSLSAKDEKFVKDDVKFLLQEIHQRYEDLDFEARYLSPRMAAFVLQGLDSLVFPAKVWSASPFWRRYLHCTFRDVQRCCNDVLKNGSYDLDFLVQNGHRICIDPDPPPMQTLEGGVAAVLPPPT
jgi:hypothetical protein